MIKQEYVVQPCWTCSNNRAVLDMRRELDVGFGNVEVTLDGVSIWNFIENCIWLEDESYVWTTYDAEFRARQANAKDARIKFDGPLWGGTYLRVAPYEWVLIEQNEGFA